MEKIKAWWYGLSPAARVGIGIAALVAALGILFGQPAKAEPCAPRDVIVEVLSTEYGESRQSIGIAANNAVLEVFASTETGTWTVLMTMPGGPTCAVASGVAFDRTDNEGLEPTGLRI